MSQEIYYVTPPVSPERKAELIGKGYKLINARYAPEDWEDPEAEDVVPNVDSKGLPWDERIHASTKTLNKDGTWKAKKGVDKDTVTQVEAELLLAVQPE